VPRVCGQRWDAPWPQPTGPPPVVKAFDRVGVGGARGTAATAAAASGDTDLDGPASSVDVASRTVDTVTVSSPEEEVSVQ